MVVVVEFTIPSESFPLGKAICGDPDVTVALESVVPWGGRRMPYLWAISERSEEFDRLERSLRESELVRSVEALTREGDSVLYEVEWRPEKERFLNGIVDNGGTIVDAHCAKASKFTVRFCDHVDLTRFHQFYQAHDFPVEIERVYTLAEEGHTNFGFNLTTTQRQAVLMAVERGYFSVPRETTLEELAGELDISRQALSEQVRRGTAKVLRRALLGLSTEDVEVAEADRAGP